MINTTNITLTSDELDTIQDALRLLKRETRKVAPKANKDARILSAKLSWMEHKNSSEYKLSN